MSRYGLNEAPRVQTFRKHSLSRLASVALNFVSWDLALLPLPQAWPGLLVLSIRQAHETRPQGLFLPVSPGKAVSLSFSFSRSHCGSC